jgi:leucine-zipper of insertion element IS481
MNLHANAALSLKGRRELCLAVVERERTLAQAAEAAGVSVRCARKWVGRYRAEGPAGLRDRCSAPHRIPHRTSDQRTAAYAFDGEHSCGVPGRRDRNTPIAITRSPSIRSPLAVQSGREPRVTGTGVKQPRPPAGRKQSIGLGAGRAAPSRYLCSAVIPDATSRALLPATRTAQPAIELSPMQSCDGRGRR